MQQPRVARTTVGSFCIGRIAVGKPVPARCNFRWAGPQGIGPRPDQRPRYEDIPQFRTRFSLKAGIGVEVIAADEIGREIVTLRNIYKYFITHRPVLDRKTERDATLKTARPKSRRRHSA
jgi:hypothetical protein